MHRPRALIVLSLVATLAACDNGDDGARPTATATPSAIATATPVPSASPTCACLTPTATPPPSPTVTATASATPVFEGATALFSRDPLNPANPFPSDRLLDETGHVHITGELLGADLPAQAQYDNARSLANVFATQAATLTGFSTFAPIRVKLDKAVVIPDPVAHDGVMLLRYDDPAVTAPITATAVTPDVSGDYAIEIRPVVPLRPKTRYVYVVTRAVQDAASRPLRPSAQLSAALHDTGAWRSALDPVLLYLDEHQGISLDDIAAIDSFTTLATTEDLVAIRDLFDSGTLPAASPLFDGSPLPGLTTGIFAEGTPEFTDLMGSATSANVAAVAIGGFDSFDFRTGSNGAFDPARVSGLVTPTVNRLDFYMTIPKAPPPAGGYPITIFGHGLGGSGRDCTFVSQLVGDEPMMAIGISDVEHGRRGNVANFFVVTSGLITRERFRQTIADYLQLARMVRHATVAPFDQVNKDRVNYMGVSLGGIMGTLYMGVETQVRAGVLSVPGGGLPNILQSEAIGQLLQPLISLTFGIPLDDPYFGVFLYRFTQVSQWLLDPADPINTAPYLLGPDTLPGVPPKRILMHEGVVDNVVPNRTTDDLALAMRLPDVKASHGCNSAAGCSGIWRYVMTDYGQDEFSGHSVTGIIAQAGAQAAGFLGSDGTEILDAAP
ncbi:MAG: hypothetical protein HY699_17205 [Deltaproteobacteria bacterium]|nr:hypothetical protein [Deltaproteobacteria bacterium]